MRRPSRMVRYTKPQTVPNPPLESFPSTRVCGFLPNTQAFRPVMLTYFLSAEFLSSLVAYCHIHMHCARNRKCWGAGYTREILFLTDGGVSGHEEERIMGLVTGGVAGDGKSKVSTV